MINGGAINSGPINALSEATEPFDDWAAVIDPVTSQIYYALELDDGVLDAIRIPISSWQATVQTDRASYAQAVIPAATQWIDAVTARAGGEFIVYRGVRYQNGDTQEAELARAPLNDVRVDRGPTNVTMTISGYATLEASGTVLNRTLTNVRSESISGGFRVRADLDFFLRPGHQATSRGTTFTVSYINYYVTGGDEYMDVGERAL